MRTHRELFDMPAELTLRGPPNWTAVCFFAGLAGLHLAVALPAFLKGRWEGYLSLVLAAAFIVISGVATRFRSELTILIAERQLRLRQGLRRLYFERLTSFSAVHGVRLTLAGDAGGPGQDKIELLCPRDDIICPPSRIPRQQALYLAMLMDVPLIKVCEGEASARARIDATHHSVHDR